MFVSNICSSDGTFFTKTSDRVKWGLPANGVKTDYTIIDRVARATCPGPIT